MVLKNIIHMNIEISRMKGRSSFGKRPTVNWMLRVLQNKRNSKWGFEEA